MRMWGCDLYHSLFILCIIGFQNKRAMWKFENLRIFAARFVRFSASTTLVFNVLSHLDFFNN